MTTFAIAGVQLEAHQGDNLGLISQQVDIVMARFPWVRMIVFGELCAFGTNPGNAQPMPGPAEDHLRGLARKHGVWLIPGSLYEAHDDKIYNTAPVIDPSGEVVERHRKLYPFLPYEKGVDAGRAHTVFDVPEVGRFGLSICYDMWFPETTRALAWMGAEVIIHPSLTNTIDRQLEITLARANAVMNQCYFVDINNAGTLGYGLSVVAGPEGEIVHQAGTTQETIPVMVDLARVRRTRRDGLMGLGQVLKSFRDGGVEYPQYLESAKSAALESHGPLRMMAPGKRVPKAAE